MIRSAFIGLAWDAPVGYVPDRYEVRWFLNGVQVGSESTTKTEIRLTFMDPVRFRFEVVAFRGEVASKPCALWVEEFDLAVRWNGTAMEVSWPTMRKREYWLEMSNDLTTWVHAGNGPGTGETVVMTIPAAHSAQFRVWSRPREEG